MTVEIDTNDRYYENNHDCPAEIKYTTQFSNSFV